MKRATCTRCDLERVIFNRTTILRYIYDQYVEERLKTKRTGKVHSTHLHVVTDSIYISYMVGKEEEFLRTRTRRCAGHHPRRSTSASPSSRTFADASLILATAAASSPVEFPIESNRNRSPKD